MAAEFHPEHVSGRKYIMCHMIADTEDELHAMADRIGVNRKWFQGDHYDIARSKRRRAVRFGAVEITWREAGRIMGIRRKGGFEPIPVPATIEKPAPDQMALL